jgi:hypothetical protein
MKTPAAGTDHAEFSIQNSAFAFFDEGGIVDMALRLLRGASPHGMVAWKAATCVRSFFR